MQAGAIRLSSGIYASLGSLLRRSSTGDAGVWRSRDVMAVERALGRRTAVAVRRGAPAAGGVGGCASPLQLPRSPEERPLDIVGRLALVHRQIGGRRAPATGGVDALGVVGAAPVSSTKTVSVGGLHGGRFFFF